MEKHIDIIDEFNKHLSSNTSLCVDMRVGWDLDGCSEFILYELLSDQRKASFGEVLYRRVGSFCQGPYYEEKGVAGFNHSAEPHLIERFFPLSANEVCSRLEIGYKSHRLGGRRNFSKDNFKRWWVDSFSTLSNDFPNQAQKVERLLIREIKALAETAHIKGYKSGWVYHQFLNKQEELSKRINLDLIISTTYLFKPILYFNQFSPKLVSLNDQEKRELRARIQNEQLRQEGFNRW